MSIWVITNFILYIVELLANFNFFKHVKRTNRQKLFKISLSIDVFRYLFTIIGLVMFYG